MVIRIGLLGARGKMGTMIGGLLRDDFCERAEAVVAVNRGDAMDGLLAVDVIVDFSSPEGTLALLKSFQGVTLPPLVSGTTGWDGVTWSHFQDLASEQRVLWAANFSHGIYALEKILEEAGPMLRTLGYQPVLTEAHHIHKVDAPSGTAKVLQRAVAPENPDSVQTHAIRAGEVIGRHHVCFYGAFDELTIGHRANSRLAFAQGAVEVALWFSQSKKAGLYGLGDYFKDRPSQPS